MTLSMKLVAVALLFPGMMCNSMLAMAQGPVPFSAYMQAAGAQPSIPPTHDAKDQFTAVSNHPAHPTHMTRGGKIMTATGITMLAAGGVLVFGTAAIGPWAGHSEAGLYGAGGGLLAGGATLTIVGLHRRSPK